MRHIPMVPLKDEATDTLKNLAYMMIQAICSTPTDHCIITEGRHHTLHIPTEPNGWNCVYYVMQCIQTQVEEFIQEFRSLDFVSMAQIRISELMLSSILVLITIVV